MARISVALLAPQARRAQHVVRGPLELSEPGESVTDGAVTDALGARLAVARRGDDMRQIPGAGKLIATANAGPDAREQMEIAHLSGPPAPGWRGTARRWSADGQGDAYRQRCAACRGPSHGRRPGS